MIIDIHNLTPYTWGNNCQAWKLVDSAALSVIYEEMPTGSSETLHKHVNVQQLFYILEGEAVFNMADKEYVIGPSQSIYVYPGVAHCIRNAGVVPLKLLVISQPHSHFDRIEL